MRPDDAMRTDGELVLQRLHRTFHRAVHEKVFFGENLADYFD
jgi:hypothetical protein